MNKQQKENLLLKIINLALKAGDEICKIYNSDFSFYEKQDKSPLTEADLISNKIIIEGLKQTEFPVISEETELPPYDERKKWDIFWLVDPLDGTKEFIKRLNQFTVNIALIINELPELGVVYVPAEKTLYFGDIDLGAYKIINPLPHYDDYKQLSRDVIFLPVEFNAPLGVVASKSHLDDKTKQFIQSLQKQHKDLNVFHLGSSVKFCILAEGKAHFYPRFAPTYEWDTAAGHAILRATAGTVMDYETKDELRYNKETLLNPSFIAYRNG